MKKVPKDPKQTKPVGIKNVKNQKSLSDYVRHLVRVVGNRENN